VRALKPGPHCRHVDDYMYPIRTSRHLHVDGDFLMATYRRLHVEAMFDLRKDSLACYVIYLINIHEPPRSIWGTEAHAP